MANIVLAIYLIVIGLSAFVNLSLPSWVTGALALIAGILLLVPRLSGKK